MNELASLPLWVAIATSVLVVLGAVFALIGSIGLLTLPSFYERMHPPTLGTTFGTALVCLASMLLLSWIESRLVVQELVLIVFVVVTTPITYTLLAGAAVRRDREQDGARD